MKEFDKIQKLHKKSPILIKYKSPNTLKSCPINSIVSTKSLGHQGKQNTFKRVYRPKKNYNSLVPVPSSCC